MNGGQAFPYEKDILALSPGEQFVLIIKGRMFVITPATEEDLDQVNQGSYCFD